jgi:hypothetical protein
MPNWWALGLGHLIHASASGLRLFISKVRQPRKRTGHERASSSPSQTRTPRARSTSAASSSCTPPAGLLPRLGPVPGHHRLPAAHRGRTRPHDSELTGPVDELVIRSEDFRAAWAKHNVRLHHTGRKRFRHPAVGVITLDFDAMELPAQPGLTLTAYTAGDRHPR